MWGNTGKQVGLCPDLPGLLAALVDVATRIDLACYGDDLRLVPLAERTGLEQGFEH